MCGTMPAYLKSKELGSGGWLSRESIPGLSLMAELKSRTYKKLEAVPWNPRVPGEMGGRDRKVLGGRNRNEGGTLPQQGKGRGSL